MSEIKEARLSFYKAARNYCETWEIDFRNAKDSVKAQFRLYEARNEMFNKYRELVEIENANT